MSSIHWLYVCSAVMKFFCPHHSSHYYCLHRQYGTPTLFRFFECCSHVLKFLHFFSRLWGILKTGSGVGYPVIWRPAVGKLEFYPIILGKLEPTIVGSRLTSCRHNLVYIALSMVYLCPWRKKWYCGLWLLLPICGCIIVCVGLRFLVSQKTL